MVVDEEDVGHGGLAFWWSGGQRVSGAGSATGGGEVSPRELTVPRAPSAAAARKTLAARSASPYPPTRAWAGPVWIARRWSVRVVASAEKTARPTAIPSWREVLRSPAASPAWLAGTPAFAATVAPTKTAPRPRDM